MEYNGIQLMTEFYMMKELCASLTLTWPLLVKRKHRNPNIRSLFFSH